jgi:hypothetical protein
MCIHRDRAGGSDQNGTKVSPLDHFGLWGSWNHSLYDALMKKPPADPDVADVAPTDSVLTVYDEEHIITYLRMLDADAEGADWHEVAQLVLHIDPEREHDRARRAFDSHLTRAKWMTEHGYRHLLRGGASNPNL